MIWSMPAVGVRTLVPSKLTFCRAMLSWRRTVTSIESPTLSFAPATGARKVSVGFCPSVTVNGRPGLPARV